MFEIFKILTIVFAFVVLAIFIAVTYIIGKKEDKNGLGVAIFIVVAQVLQIICLLL